jgi:hypothetical protein
MTKKLENEGRWERSRMSACVGRYEEHGKKSYQYEMVDE